MADHRAVETQVNIREAKTHLSRLLRQVEGGERVVIARAGKPIAIIEPITKAKPRRVPGHDRIVMHPDFDDSLPEFDRDYMHPDDPLRELIG